MLKWTEVFHICQFAAFCFLTQTDFIVVFFLFILCCCCVVYYVKHKLAFQLDLHVN